MTEFVSFESDNRPGWYIRHTSFLGVLTQFRTESRSVLDSSPLEKADATFIIWRPGLSGIQDSVSFESANHPSYFRRHQNYRLKLQQLQPNDDRGLFDRDASFFWRQPEPGKDLVSLESVNFPDHFIRHQNLELWLARRDAGNTLT